MSENSLNDSGLPLPVVIILVLHNSHFLSVNRKESSGWPNHNLTMNEGHVFTYVLPTLLFSSTARTYKEVFIKRAYHTHTLADVGLRRLNPFTPCWGFEVSWCPGPAGKSKTHPGINVYISVERWEQSFHRKSLKCSQHICLIFCCFPGLKDVVTKRIHFSDNRFLLF